MKNNDYLIAKKDDMHSALKDALHKQFSIDVEMKWLTTYLRENPTSCLKKEYLEKLNILAENNLQLVSQIERMHKDYSAYSKRKITLNAIFFVQIILVLLVCKLGLSSIGVIICILGGGINVGMVFGTYRKLNITYKNLKY